MKPGIQANQVRETSPPNHPSNPQQQQQPQQNNLKREFHISQATKDRANACKAYIERKYSKLKHEEQEKKDAWEMLQKKMENMNISSTEQELIKRDIIHKETERYRKKRTRITVKDFEPIAIIGRGAFGEVRVCKIKETSEVVAMKKMNKTDMIVKNQIAHVRAERDVLATTGNPWIVELKSSFQDDKYLYLVMEYLAGGDLMTLLMKKDILSEEEAKFYIAEAILAVESVHKMNYIHRDLKPDNILLDAKGHLKLSDFGLCKHVEIRPRVEFKKPGGEVPQETNDYSNLTKKPQNYRRNRQLVYSTVGTPDYIAPEVFGQNGYTETVDWWSLGVILFEMLVGYPPFFSEDPSMTCQKILHWRKTLVIPPEANLSSAAIDLLKRLITDANERLGVNGVEEIKFHPFFAGVDWKRIRDKKPPNVPELKSDYDTSNFDKFEEEDPWYIEDLSKKRSRKDANFVGYTFKRDDEAQRSHLVTALQDLEANRFSYIRPQKTQPTTNPPMRGQENMISSPNPLAKSSNIQPTQGQNVLTNSSSVNIMNAISSIAQMNSTNFPASNQTFQREQIAKTNYAPYNDLTPSVTSYQGGGFGVKSKSPTNAATREKLVQQPSGNIKPNTPKNPILKVETPNPVETLLKKKDLNANLYPYMAETTATNKMKYTSTNNPIKQYSRPAFANADNYPSVSTKSSIKSTLNPQTSTRPIGYNKYA